MNIVDELHAVAAALQAAGIPCAVCGGIAVTAAYAGALDLADIAKLEGRDDS